MVKRLPLQKALPTVCQYRLARPRTRYHRHCYRQARESWNIVPVAVAVAATLCWLPCPHFAAMHGSWWEETIDDNQLR